jgi:glutamate carboxypeptidase
MNLVDTVRVVKAGEGRLRSRLRTLVKIESPSDDKLAVDRAGMLVQEWVKALEGKVKRHKNRSFGDVLEVRFGFSSKKNQQGRVLLLGHLDTVWPIGTLQSMPWREIEGTEGLEFWGPGVLDMKAGIVMALEALAAVRELGAERPVTLLLNSDEEVGSPVSRSITESVARECTAVFVLEPAQGLAYKTSRKGVGHFHLKVEGVGAHSGVDFERGHSAVLEMAKLAQHVSGFTDLTKGLTVNVGVIAGGTRSNVVAAACSAEVDIRIMKASDAKQIENKFRSLETNDKACHLKVTGGINRPPMERKAGTVKLFRQAGLLAEEMGFVLKEAGTGGGSDGNFTAALGVPTLDGMGAVGAGAHATHEHIVAKYLIERTALLAGMISEVD